MRLFQNNRTEYKNKGLVVVVVFCFFFMIFERRTNLGLGYRGAFSITQRREGQAEFQLSITLTKIEKEKGREDILKGIPLGSENNFLKVIWFHRLGLPRCSNTAVLAAFWQSLWREASLTSYFERLQHLLHSLRLFCSSRGPSSENRKRCIKSLDLTEIQSRWSHVGEANPLLRLRRHLLKEHLTQSIWHLKLRTIIYDYSWLDDQISLCALYVLGNQANNK